MAIPKQGICFISLGLLAGQAWAYTGGVAIRYPNTSCPTGTFYTGTSFAANCCTDGTYGAPGGSSYCCPSESDCKTTVENLIQCANSSWTYFPSPDNAAIGFCCLPDWVGYVQSDSSGSHLGVACEEPGYVLEANQTTVPSLKLAAQTTVTIEPTASSTLVTISANPTTTSTSSSTSSATSSPSSGSSSGLSTGAQAGIGVGVAVGVLGIAGLVCLCCLPKRRRAAGTDSQAAEVESKPESMPKDNGVSPHPVESGGQSYSEMAATPLTELGSETRTHELPADYPGSK